MTWGGADGIRIERKSTMNVMRLNHPKTTPTSNTGLWKNCLPGNQALVPERLGTVLQSSGPAEGTIPRSHARALVNVCTSIFSLSWLGRGSYWRLIGWRLRDAVKHPATHRAGTPPPLHKKKNDLEQNGNRVDLNRWFSDCPVHQGCLESLLQRTFLGPIPEFLIL